MSEDNSSSGCGFNTLTIIFIILKLTKTVDWPWLWVLAPTWIPMAFTVVIFIGLLCLALFVAAIGGTAIVWPNLKR